NRVFSVIARPRTNHTNQEEIRTMNCKPAIKSVEMTHNCNRKAKSAIAAIALLASALMLSNDQALARGESVLRGGHAENYGGRASYGSPGVGRGFSHLAAR